LLPVTTLAGPLAYVACMAACMAGTFILGSPACAVMCASALAVPTP
ncbi:unnamed protein product, partial [Rotaria sordida]